MELDPGCWRGFPDRGRITNKGITVEANNFKWQCALAVASYILTVSTRAPTEAYHYLTVHRDTRVRSFHLEFHHVVLRVSELCNSHLCRSQAPAPGTRLHALLLPARSPLSIRYISAGRIHLR